MPTVTHKLVPIRCTASEHRTVHRYAKALGRKASHLLRGLSFTTLHARATWFNSQTFATPEDFAKALTAEQVWVARRSD